MAYQPFNPQQQQGLQNPAIGQQPWNLGPTGQQLASGQGGIGSGQYGSVLPGTQQYVTREALQGQSPQQYGAQVMQSQQQGLQSQGQPFGPIGQIPGQFGQAGAGPFGNVLPGTQQYVTRDEMQRQGMLPFAQGGAVPGIQPGQAPQRFTPGIPGGIQQQPVSPFGQQPMSAFGQQPGSVTGNMGQTGSILPGTQPYVTGQALPGQNIQPSTGWGQQQGYQQLPGNQPQQQQGFQPQQFQGIQPQQQGFQPQQPIYGQLPAWTQTGSPYPTGRA